MSKRISKKTATRKSTKKTSHKSNTYVGLMAITFNDMFGASSKKAMLDYAYFKSMVNVPSLKFYLEVLNEFAFGLLLFMGLFMGTMLTSASISSTGVDLADSATSTFAKESGVKDEYIALENVERKVLGTKSLSDNSCSFDIKGNLYSSMSTYVLVENEDVYVCAKGLVNKDARWFLVDNNTGESVTVTHATEIRSGDTCAVVRNAKAGQVVNLNAYAEGQEKVTSCTLKFVK